MLPTYYRSVPQVILLFTWKGDADPEIEPQSEVDSASNLKCYLYSIRGYRVSSLTMSTPVHGEHAGTFTLSSIILSNVQPDLAPQLFSSTPTPRPAIPFTPFRGFSISPWCKISLGNRYESFFPRDFACGMSCLGAASWRLLIWKPGGSEPQRRLELV